MIVDFHVHSTSSDGTLSPKELALEALSKNFRAIALTDHDNANGVEEFTSASLIASIPSPSPCARIAGIELSIEPGASFDKFHLLGLGIDPKNEKLKKFLRSILAGRNERNKKILENFSRLGIEIASEDIANYSNGEVLARPHFARWLMLHGYSPSIKEAFAKFLLPDSPRQTRCYEKRYHPSQEEAFDVIHSAGGLCIMAHPKYWRRNWKDIGPDFDAAEKELKRLKEAGLDGIEALYEANTIEENITFTRIANRLKVLKSCGSDFHGANKPTIHLGMEATEEFISPLLEKLAAAQN